MFSTKGTVSVLAAVAAAAAIITPWQSAEATTGYFSHGYGAISQGMAGVGTAIPQDTQSSMRNPAAMVDVGNRLDLGITLFSPQRDVTAEGAGFVRTGKTKSGKTLFEIPDMGGNWMIGDTDSIGITLSGNGGMNTHLQPPIFQGGTGPTGVDLMQAFVGVTYAHKLTEHSSIGITPVFAAQRFKAYGLEPFMANSIDSAHVTNQGYDYSYGGGVRIGYLVEILKGLNFGVAYQTQMWMSKLDKYRGLFAEQGDFDIPAALQMGVAYNFTPDILFGFDWEHIFYSQVKSIGNTGNTMAALGSDEGPGFGWSDIDVLRLGAQWKVNQQFTLRAGFSYNTKPFNGQEILFNTVAPGVISTHASIGATYNINEHHSISFAYTRAFSDSVKGITPAAYGSQPLELRMDQNMGSISYSYSW